MSVEASTPRAYPQPWEITSELERRNYQVQRFLFSKEYKVKTPNGSTRILKNENEFVQWGCVELNNKFGLALHVPEINRRRDGGLSEDGLQRQEQEADALYGVGGWLLLLCLNLTIFSPVLALINLANLVSGWPSAAALHRYPDLALIIA